MTTIWTMLITAGVIELHQNLEQLPQSDWTLWKAVRVDAVAVLAVVTIIHYHLLQSNQLLIMNGSMMMNGMKPAELVVKKLMNNSFGTMDERADVVVYNLMKTAVTIDLVAMGVNVV